MAIIPNIMADCNLLQLLAGFEYNEMMVVTAIQENKKNKGRVSVFLDDEFGFACYKETLLNERLAIGQQLAAEDIARIRSADGAEYAWNSAVQYLSRGLYTEKQVSDRLRAHGADADVIAQTLERLRECGLVDDAEFAHLYAQKMYERYGRYEVARRLKQKGVAGDLVDEVTQSAGDMAVLEKHAERLWRRCSADDPRKRAAKVMRSLAARGFAFDDIRQAVQSLERSSVQGELYEL